MFESPSYEASFKSSLDNQYGDLFEKLGLSSEEVAEFKDIFFNKEKAQHEVSMALWDTSEMSGEEQEEVSSRYQEAEDNANSELASFLGESRYNTYETYMETQSQRSQVTDYMGYLDSDDALTESQQETLIEAMYESRQYVVYDELEPVEEDDSDSFFENNIDLIKANNDREFDAYLTAAGSVLSASQLEKFNEYIETEKKKRNVMFEMIVLQSSASAD